MWRRHYQPGSALSVGDGKTRVRRIAIVVLARKLLVVLWRYLETGLPDWRRVQGALTRLSPG
jgi:transposase